MNRTKISIITIAIFGLLLAFIGTDGFQAFTGESARTIQLMKEQPKFPEVTLEDSKKREYSLAEFKGKYVMLTFIYTTCMDVCIELEFNLADVYEQIPEEYIGEDIIFMSVSFNPEVDTPEVLDVYRTFFNSDGETWRMARVTDEEELAYVLDEFGIIVIPDDHGHFAHNAAFYLVDREGKLIEVMDYQEVDAAAEKVTNYLQEKVGDAA